MTSTQLNSLNCHIPHFQLEEVTRLHLFDEYIELVIQYGYVTLFAATFPLAPGIYFLLHQTMR